MRESKLESFVFTAGVISIGAIVLAEEYAVKILKNSLSYFGQSYQFVKRTVCGFDEEYLNDFCEKTDDISLAH